MPVTRKADSYDLVFFSPKVAPIDISSICLSHYPLTMLFFAFPGYTTVLMDKQILPIESTLLLFSRIS